MKILSKITVLVLCLMGISDACGDALIQLVENAMKLGTEKCIACAEGEDVTRREFKQRLEHLLGETQRKVLTEAHEKDLTSGMWVKEAEELKWKRSSNAVAWHIIIFRGQAFFELSQEEVLTEAIKSLEQSFFERDPRYTIKWPE